MDFLRLRARLAFVLVVSVLLLLPAPSFALEDPGAGLEQIGVDSSKLGQPINKEILLIGEDGKEVTIGDLLRSGRPLIVTPVYYDCPRLCGFFFSGFVSLLNELELTLGKDFQIASISFDPDEGPELAAEKGKEWRGRLAAHQAAGAESWRFFVGAKDQVEPLMKQLGFNYAPDGPEFAHSAAFIILTPEGEVSQYFTGIDFPAWDVKLAMVDASKGAIGSAIDHILLFCFRFDQTKGKYTWAAFNVMRSGVIFSVLVMGAFVLASSRKRLT